uniref:Methyltransferase FkbM family n=1 Tax=Solibacter usitatus (strain Ellin6076) TaxID=234267 RepID=Q02BB0_SOLUE
MSVHSEGREIYLSIVVAARNDNHGGNMLGRMQAFVDSWMEQAEQLGISSEIIVVEWNPPSERSRLAAELRWKETFNACEVRFLEVSPDLHRKYPNAAAIPLHQMIAKNVGIRRARGQFVLATNIDILFSPELMRFLSTRSLERGVMYRMDRHDVASEIPTNATLLEMQSFCESNMLRVFAREGTFELLPNGRRRIVARDIVSQEDGIDLDDGWFMVEVEQEEAFRWIEATAVIRIERPEWASPELVLDVETGPSAGTPLPIDFLDPDGKVLASVMVDGRCSVKVYLPEGLNRAEIRLLVRGSHIPLARDLRFLSLRVYSVRWCSAGAEFVQKSTRELIPELTRSGGPSPAIPDIQLAGVPLIEMLDVQLEPRGAGEFALSVRFKAHWEPAGRAVQKVFPEVVSEVSPRLPAWSTEVTQVHDARDWSCRYEAPSPVADGLTTAAYLHTNACGDFTLLSREDWFALRAYPEFPIWPMHIDSLICYSAHHAGIREVILREPMRIYHIQHFSGAGWTPEGEGERTARIEAKKVAVIEYATFLKWIDLMRRFRVPMIFNRNDWGMGDAVLPEGKAVTETAPADPLHPVFGRFRRYRGPGRNGFIPFDFLGSFVREDYIGAKASYSPSLAVDYPRAGEDIFAWIDLLEAVVGARKKFRMMELGAAYGCWAGRGALAAIQLGLDFEVTCVEAEPEHFQWIEQHMLANSIPLSSVHSTYAALAGKPGSVLFSVYSPYMENCNAGNWQGQVIVGPEDMVVGSSGNYHGVPLLTMKSGFKAIEVPAVTLDEVLCGGHVIDFMHVDLQGAELGVFSAGMESVDRLVKRVNIGTHSTACEEGLRVLFRACGWECLADYSLAGERQTPYGKLRFQDGVQSWRNPKL